MVNEKVFVIAEIGINHNGSVKIAKELVDMAHACGCDAVKFQKRTIDVVYSQEYLDGPRESPWGTTQRHQKYGLEFCRSQYEEINDHCKQVGIPWFVSCWDTESQMLMRSFDLPYNKVASAMLTHEPLLKMIAEEGKHTFISTGMSNFRQIKDAVHVFRNEYQCPFTLMHAVSTYPCRDEDCNIRMVQSLRAEFQCPVGYSGHETGITPSILAVSLGATAIERHISLDRTMYGSDQAASLEKRGLELLVRDVRSVKEILGDGIKRVIGGERKTKQSLRYFRAA